MDKNKVKVVRLMTPKEIQDEIEERKKSKKKIEMECESGINEFNRKQEERKKKKVS